MSQRRKVSWSNLPEELLYPIAHRLETRFDILNFRAVCKEWHNSVSLALLSDKNILSAVLPHKLSTTNPPLLRGGASERMEDFMEYFVYKPVVLVAGLICLIKPAFGQKLSPWLVTVEEMNSGKLVVRKPICRSAVEDMPRNFPKMLDLSRFEVEEMGRVYSLRYDVEPNYHLFEEQHKVLLLPDFDRKVSSSKIEDYSAAVLYDSGVLAVINLRTEVVKQACFKARKFDDIIVFKGMVYSIDRYGRLYWMDNSSNKKPKMVIVVQEALHSGNERKSRLFESCGELYMVRKCLMSRPSLKRRCMGIRLYKLNQETNTWDELDSIGDDRILFVTPDCCFFVRAADLPGWKGSGIISHDTESFPSYSQTDSYAHDWDQSYKYILERVRNTKTGLEVFHNGVFEPVETYPGYSVVFWPPPKWISSNTCSPERTKTEEIAVDGHTDRIEDLKAKIIAESDGLEQMNHVWQSE